MTLVLSFDGVSRAKETHHSLKTGGPTLQMSFQFYSGLNFGASCFIRGVSGEFKTHGPSSHESSPSPSLHPHSLSPASGHNKAPLSPRVFFKPEETGMWVTQSIIKK